jgi:UDP-N-acetyl-D-mannosaminuronate dehydrogenase
VLVLGLTYRHGVKELAYSRGVALLGALAAAGAQVLAYDPLLTDDEVRRVGAEPWTWGSIAPGVRAIVAKTGDPTFLTLDAAWFPDLTVFVDGRNALRSVALPAGVTYRGFGVT